MTATTERPQGTVTVGDVPDLRCYDVILAYALLNSVRVGKAGPGG